MKSHTYVSIDEELKKEAIRDKVNLSQILNNELEIMYSNKVEIKKQMRRRYEVNLNLIPVKYKDKEHSAFIRQELYYFDTIMEELWYQK